ncbi:ferritin-like domain-containing protein [Patulibacter americanus]|uniref:ferritin-like domain-containing protein n=1 Tax=Patulibacter americanus TaxID=588672 RepID=UPI00068821B8|nr:ferritin-like domain-containing protein [Patulibacter americanus]
MSTEHRPVTIDELDRSGGLREAAEAAGVDRRVFLGRAGAVGAGAAGAVLGLPTLADAAISSRPSRRNDVRILNFALTLEHLDTAFYTAALAANDLPNAAYVRFAQVARAHEAQHVTTLQALLGAQAVAAPAFDFGDAVSRARFPAVAQLLEDTAVEAFAGQGARIHRRGALKVALAMQSVEARHASWIRSLNVSTTPYGLQAADEGALPAPRAFDTGRGERTILRRVQATGFVRSPLPTDQL